MKLYISRTVILPLLPQASPGHRKASDLNILPVLMLPKVLRNLCFAQDWYLYHIVCLRVLDFFKSRRDFLPNLLRHISTSAIADTFKYFIRLDDLFNKIIMEVSLCFYFYIYLCSILSFKCWPDLLLLILTNKHSLATYYVYSVININNMYMVYKRHTLSFVED